MILDNHSKDIVLISYPSGGFGHFLFHILTGFCKETVKAYNTEFKFSEHGDSHATKLYTETFFKDPDEYFTEIAAPYSVGSKILVLCDNGINHDSYSKILKTFPNGTIVRTVIDYDIRPVIYQTCIVKAKKDDLLDTNSDHVKDHWTDSDEEYAIRENFTLLYQNWPFGWEPIDGVINFSLEGLITNPVSSIEWLSDKLNLTIQNREQLEDLCSEWVKTNKSFFAVYYNWQDISRALEANTDISLDHITNLHDQGYINHRIEQKYNVIIPVYDYRDWFKTTGDILKMVHNVQNKNFNS